MRYVEITCVRLLLGGTPRRRRSPSVRSRLPSAVNADGACHDTGRVTSTQRSVYDSYWADGGFTPPPNGNRFLAAKITELCTAGTVVVDLGCGDARTIGDQVVQRDVDYTGLDISPSAVARATDRGLDVRLVEDISATGLPEKGSDVVFVVEVLEHLLDPMSAVQEAYRILKPGGSLLITVPNAAVWPRRLELLALGRPNAMGDDLSRSQPWRDPHIRSFTVSTLRALLCEVFEQVTVGGTEPVAPRRIGEQLVSIRPTMFARRVTGHAIRTCD